MPSVFISHCSRPPMCSPGVKIFEQGVRQFGFNLLMMPLYVVHSCSAGDLSPIGYPSAYIDQSASVKNHPKAYRSDIKQPPPAAFYDSLRAVRIRSTSLYTVVPKARGQSAQGGLSRSFALSIACAIRSSVNFLASTPLSLPGKCRSSFSEH